MIEQKHTKGRRALLGAKYDNNEHTFQTIFSQDAPF